MPGWRFGLTDARRIALGRQRRRKRSRFTGDCHDLSLPCSVLRPIARHSVRLPLSLELLEKVRGFGFGPFQPPMSRRPRCSLEYGIPFLAHALTKEKQRRIAVKLQ